MPNHLHALVTPLGKTTLGEIVRHWKGGSAFEINRLLGRRGSLWMTEFFDHIVRSEAQMERFRKYIADNPKKAGLLRGFVAGNGNVF
jgi:REP element-mobilizing transposase RayT